MHAQENALYAPDMIMTVYSIRTHCIYLWGGWGDDRLMVLIQTAGARERKEKIDTYSTRRNKSNN